MSGQVIQAPCRYCQGSGRAEQLLERTSDGWAPNRMLPHDLADAWIAADRYAPIRWEDCDCPVCGGTGSYELETTPCRIF